MTEVIETELIPDYIAAFEYEPPVATSVAWIKGGKGNIPVRYPRWNELTIAGGTVAETVDAPDVTVDLAESSITPAMVRFRMPISDEVAVEAMSGIPQGALNQGLTAMIQRMDSDGLSSSTSATNTVGAVGTAFGLAEFHTARQNYRARRLPGSLHALVLHDDALDALENSIRNNSSPWAIKPNEQLAAAVGSQFQGQMAGFQIFLAGQVADESTGHSNFATPMGGESGLGIVLNELPSVRVTRGDTAENRASTFYHFRMWYGFGLTNPRRFLEVLSA
jgi:hypothetical protein